MKKSILILLLCLAMLLSACQNSSQPVQSGSSEPEK